MARCGTWRSSFCELNRHFDVSFFFEILNENDRGEASGVERKARRPTEKSRTPNVAHAIAKRPR